MPSALSEPMAHQLSLEYRKGAPAAALFHRCKVLEMGDSQGRSILDQLESPSVASPLMTWVPMSAAEGLYRGFQVYLCSDIRSPNHILCCMLLADPVETRFLIFREAFLSKLAKKLFAIQDLQIGDPDLDSLVMVKSDTPPDTLALLRRPAGVQSLLTLYQAHPEAVINAVSTRLTLVSPTAEQLQSALDLMQAVASALRQDRGGGSAS